jgi:SAM-dependent methyltransferase
MDKMLTPEDDLSCCVCGSKKIKPCNKTRGYILNRCLSCGLLWIKNIENIDWAALYEEQYFLTESEIGYKNYPADENNHRKNSRNILRMVEKIKNLDRAKIMDIGCAFGFLLDEAKKNAACEAYGIERSKYAYLYGTNRLGLKIRNEDLDACAFEADSFDVVFLIGTIEHLISPVKALRKINRLLKPGGILVITTINTKGPLPVYAIKPPEHLFYFNRDNLSLLLKNEGFNILSLKTYFSHSSLYDIFFRVGDVFSLPFMKNVSGFVEKYFPKLSVKLPTNEMIVFSSKPPRATTVAAKHA